MIKLWKRCITSTKIVVIFALILMSSILIASVLNSNEEVIVSLDDNTPPVEEKDSIVWIPTKEDIAYQDSMFAIVEQTSMDVDTIKEAIDKILYKLDRIEYEDGSYDSIRYSDEEVMWIGGDGDTIWE